MHNNNNNKIISSSWAELHGLVCVFHYVVIMFTLGYYEYMVLLLLLLLLLLYVIMCICMCCCCYLYVIALCYVFAVGRHYLSTATCLILGRGRVLLTKIPSPRICSTGNRLSNFNKRISSKSSSRES